MTRSRTFSIPFRTLFVITLLTLLLSACDAGGAMEEEPERPTVDTNAPTVSITSPLASADVAGSVSIEASAADDEGMAKVEFYINGELVGTSTASPWQHTWETLPDGDGEHTLQAKAYDDAGNQGVSQVVTVTAKNGFQLSFRNTTYTTVSINPSGQPARNVSPGQSTTFTYELNPGSISYSASTKGSNGKTVRWSGQQVASKGKLGDQVSLSVGDRIFFLRLRNQSSRNTASLYVNYDRSDEVHLDPYTINGSWKDVGYFQGYSQSTIRIYSKYKFPDLGPVYWEWTENVSNQANYLMQFTLQDGVAASKNEEGGALLELVPNFRESMPTPEGLVHYGRIDE